MRRLRPSFQIGSLCWKLEDLVTFCALRWSTQRNWVIVKVQTVHWLKNSCLSKRDVEWGLVHFVHTLVPFGLVLTLPFIGTDEFGGIQLIWLLRRIKGRFYIIENKYSALLGTVEWNWQTRVLWKHQKFHRLPPPSSLGISLVPQTWRVSPLEKGSQFHCKNEGNTKWKPS